MRTVVADAVGLSHNEVAATRHRRVVDAVRVVEGHAAVPDGRKATGQIPHSDTQGWCATVVSPLRCRRPDAALEGIMGWALMDALTAVREV